MIENAYIEAVHTLLGCMLQSKTEAAQIILTMRPEDFVFDEHRLIFNTAAALFNAGDEVTPITVGAKTSAEIHELCRGCVNITPSPVVWTSYAPIIREQATLQNALPLAEKLHEEIQVSASLSDVRRQAEELVGALGDIERQKNTYTATELATEFLSTLGTPITYLDWGFDKINRHVLCEGNEYVVIGARPSVGKTAFALQVGIHIANKKRVGFFSLETDRKKITTRMMAAESFVPMSHIKHNDLSSDQLKSLALAAKTLSQKNFCVMQAAGYTIDDIRRETIARRLDVVIIDYLQLVCSHNNRIHQSEYERVSEISRQLQLMAKSLHVVVIALSQLNRSIDEYTEPDASDLRSSGQIEQDADIILLMYKPCDNELKTAEEKAEQDSLRRLKIAKCKEGICGKIKFWFNGEIQRFMQEWPDFYKKIVTKDAGKH